MPEIQSDEASTARPGIGTRPVILWLSGLAAVLVVVGAVISGEAVSWGLACGLLAAFANNVTGGLVRPVGHWWRVLQVGAGIVALVGAAIAFTAGKGAPGIFIGVAGVIIGVAVLVPGMWPASRDRYPRLFSGLR